MLPEGTLLSKHSVPKNHPQRSRERTRCRTENIDDSRISSIASAAKEDPDAVRPPQANLEVRQTSTSGPSGAHEEFLLAATAQNLRRMAEWLMPVAQEDELIPA